MAVTQDVTRRHSPTPQPRFIHTAGGMWQKRQAEIQSRHIDIYCLLVYVTVLCYILSIVLVINYLCIVKDIESESILQKDKYND